MFPDTMISFISIEALEEEWPHAFRFLYIENALPSTTTPAKDMHIPIKPEENRV